jgi:hypothetical protein
MLSLQAAIVALMGLRLPEPQSRTINKSLSRPPAFCQNAEFMRAAGLLIIVPSG